YNHPSKECVCSPGSVIRYMGRVSGPLMDRIDMHIEVTPVEASELQSTTEEESSARIRARVERARERQRRRFKEVEGVHTNAGMNSAMLRAYCSLDAASERLLGQAMERLAFSARAYDRVLKLARTIADLADRDEIIPSDIAEALAYRTLDRGTWGD
ncbi:MAG: ATP-binding protein, partial [Alistipes sp.]|nr:ATP-binding protein [Alistipes sp.]